jgi:hypothetical protein
MRVGPASNGAVRIAAPSAAARSATASVPATANVTARCGAASSLRGETSQPIASSKLDGAPAAA